MAISYNLNMQLSCDPEIVLLDIYLREMKTYVQTKTCASMFIAALLVIKLDTSQMFFNYDWLNKL